MIYLDFCKAFDMVPHNILLSKLERYGFDGWTVQCMRNWLDGRIKSVVVNGSITRQRSVTSGVPQGSILWPVLFSIFTNDSETRIKCTLSKFADDTKLSGAANMPKGWDAFQRDLDKLENWACVNLMRFSQGQVQGPAPGSGQPPHQYRLGDNELESIPAEKHLGYWWMKSLTRASNAYSQPRRPNVSWAAWREAWPAGWGRWFCPSTLLWWDPT